jgi:hypothetical protein
MSLIYFLIKLYLYLHDLPSGLKPVPWHSHKENSFYSTQFCKVILELVSNNKFFNFFARVKLESFLVETLHLLIKYTVAIVAQDAPSNYFCNLLIDFLILNFAFLLGLF